MAIVKMKRLRLIAMRPDREELLKRLQRMGCVEIGQPKVDFSDPRWENLSTPDSAALNEAREWGASLNTALDTLKKYAPVKGGLLKSRPVITEQEFFHDGVFAEALEDARAINHAQRRIQSLNAERGKLIGQKTSLAPWMALEVPLDTPSTREVTVQFGTISGQSEPDQVIAALADAAPLAQLIPASRDTDVHYVLLICHNSNEEAANAVLREYNFSAAPIKGWVGTAAENDTRLDEEIARIDAECKVEEANIIDRAGRRGILERCADRAAQEISRQEAKGLLLETEGTFYLDGWIPAASVAELERELSAFACAWETAEPTEEEIPDVPVQLRNGKIVRSLNMVTEMYALPAYNGVDPNPLMAPFFIFFYGFMMADMGYGLLMILASIVVMKKSKPNGATMRYMIPLLGYCGVATFIMGALTGGFFGDLLPQLAMMINPNTTFTALPALFSPLDDALMVLIGSLAIGLVQIFTGMAISMHKQIKRGEVMAALCNEGAWYVVFILLAVGIIAGQMKICGILIGVVLVLTQGYGKKGIVGKLMGIGGSLYNNITGYFSDILSYSRLMALMLAGAVIAQVFNTLGAITGNVITFFLIAMIGNALNFALNLLGCYVHDMRLQCLEYFGRFYEDGGRPFRPLAVNTKYVDLEKE